MKAILLDEAKKWLEENCENQYTRMAVFGIMQSMSTVDYQKTPNEPLTCEGCKFEYEETYNGSICPHHHYCSWGMPAADLLENPSDVFGFGE